MDNNPTNSLIDDFEASFMNCTCAFTKQESSIDVDKGKPVHINLLNLFLINLISDDNFIPEKHKVKFSKPESSFQTKLS